MNLKLLKLNSLNIENHRNWYSKNVLVCKLWFKNKNMLKVTQGNNIVIDGIPESTGESWADSEEKVNDIFR